MATRKKARKKAKPKKKTSSISDTAKKRKEKLKLGYPTSGGFRPSMPPTSADTWAGEEWTMPPIHSSRRKKKRK